MDINIFLFCYNESVLIPHTINHYRKVLPSCKVTICDNKSTDGSQKLAESLGCKVHEFNSNNIMNEILLMRLKNNCWKNIKDGWVIVCDMDEWLCVEEKDLIEEEKLGNTMLNPVGFDIIDKSEKLDLSDINPQVSSMGVRNKYYDKKICFKPKEIKEMNYAPGAHSCSPEGVISFEGQYLLKHMRWLGVPYFLEKNKSRYERSHKMRKIGMDIHYTNNENFLISKHEELCKKAIDLKNLCYDCF